MNTKLRSVNALKRWVLPICAKFKIERNYCKSFSNIISTNQSFNMVEIVHWPLRWVIDLAVWFLVRSYVSVRHLNSNCACFFLMGIVTSQCILTSTKTHETRIYNTIFDIYLVSAIKNIKLVDYQCLTAFCGYIFFCTIW